MILLTCENVAILILHTLTLGSGNNIEILHVTNRSLCLYNTQDSLLAAPIILDLIIIAELCERISMKVEGGEYENFHPVLSILSYLLKAPMVPPGTPVVNALFRQKMCLENIFR